MKPTDFPITVVLPEIRTTLEGATRLVLEAPPGAGKTTQVPLALLDAAWCRGKKILMLEPRRVAARSAASWMARQLGEAPGQTVGYRIRFENRISTATRIEVVTEGILTRMIQDDPLLDGVGAILFDEFHERHLAGDLGLALALDVQASIREDLRIVVMSATLDGERLAARLDAQRISSAGRAYRVDISHFPARRNETLTLQVKRCVDEGLAAHEGDVLVFLPGLRELQEAESLLQGPAYAAYSILLLYGEMPVEQQSQALESDADGRRHIILATNIAESSVTLPGVRIVIDSGLAREPRFDPGSGFSRLQTVMISQASADQRAGRAGRVAAGCCFRLWDREQRLDANRTPEIHNIDLAPLALELAAWGSSQLLFPDPPPQGALAAGKDLLQRLGALDEQYVINSLGRRMLTLGTHPRLAAMLLASRDSKEQSLACDLAALIEGRDPLSNYRGDDWHRRWQALATWRQGRQPGMQGNDSGRSLSRHALQALVQGAAQWRKRVGIREVCNEAGAHELGDVLIHAYPDRIARKHPSHPLRYQLSAGRMARLHEQSSLVGEPWLVVSELRHEQKDSLVMRASPLDEQRLQEDFPARFVEQEVVSWDPERKALVSRQESRFDQIVLASKPGNKVDPQQAAQALTRAVRDQGINALPWTDELQQWRARVQSLRGWMPEKALPDLSEEALMASSELWLLPAFMGKTRLDALSSGEFAAALRSQLNWQQQQELEQLTPTRMIVPSGLARPVHYAPGEPPVLAVKLQELFGLAETPCIAGGRVPLTLHLLSPGGKPLQITSDLGSFWRNTYPEVKKEMKGRYPKHPWPDDPWTAKATHRAKPRK